MNITNETIWEIICEIITDCDDFDDNCINFAINIYKNNYQYLEENYHKITTSDDKNKCFLIGAVYALDKRIIELMYNLMNIDVNYCDYNMDNCLTLACQYNSNIEIIRLLVETYKVNINHKNYSSENCLLIACSYNSNIEIIKYLISECMMDIDSTDFEDNDCLMLCCKHNDNAEINKFLEHYKMNKKMKM